MSSIDRATEEYIEAIKESVEYKAYRIELEKLMQNPELKVQVDEFRKRNFELQTSTDIDFEKLDRFEKEYELFRQNPVVADFLAAELDFCRMIQDATMVITDAIDFQ